MTELISEHNGLLTVRRQTIIVNNAELSWMNLDKADFLLKLPESEPMITCGHSVRLDENKRNFNQNT